jgi:hypothetical protein
VLQAGGGGATQPYGTPLTRVPVGQSAALPLEQLIGVGGSEHGLIERHDSSFGISVRPMHGIPTQYMIGRTEDKRGPMFS